ncbi:probable nucleoredoxin 1 [Cornus florida]|uniref:probable nucleoredoxin 1 n=1 Tax=Cornus florida TaxID=4283 RepID=UPI00289A688A|nr:probable nucleoredoxin 1 [Cornus florida]
MVGLYFFIGSHGGCLEFTTKLGEVYKKLKEKGENFEVVLISLDDEEEEFKQEFGKMPWLALPLKDKSCKKLVRYFELRALPTLVVIGPDGKTLHSNVAELIEEHGVEAYPFTPERLVELAEIEKAKLESQTLESILVSEDRDFVIGKGGSEVPVSELVGKNILLYFSAHWCPPCRTFLPTLITAYHEIKAKDDAFEVIFISSDRYQSAFDDFFSGMPWLALPFGDKRKAFLQRRFKIRGIPAAIAIGASGLTVAPEARQLLQSHGADAYPFTDDHIKILEERIDEIAKGWPEKVKDERHVKHELTRTRRNGYVCNGCRESGHGWSFYCKECDFDLHPKCALKDDQKIQKENGEGGTAKAEGGWTCEGGVCRKARGSHI